MAKSLNNFEYRHLHNDFYRKKKIESNTLLSCFIKSLLFYLAVLLICRYCFCLNQRCLWIRQWQIYQLIPFFYLCIQCLTSKFIIVSRSMPDIFLARLLTLGVLFSTAFNAAVVAKREILSIFPSISVILAL